MSSWLDAAAMSAGTTNPGRPVVSATNITAANGTRYPAPRNAAIPSTGNSVVSETPNRMLIALPRSAP